MEHHSIHDSVGQRVLFIQQSAQEYAARARVIHFRNLFDDVTIENQGDLGWPWEWRQPSEASGWNFWTKRSWLWRLHEANRFRTRDTNKKIIDFTYSVDLDPPLQAAAKFPWKKLQVWTALCVAPGTSGSWGVWTRRCRRVFAGREPGCKTWISETTFTLFDGSIIMLPVYTVLRRLDNIKNMEILPTFGPFWRSNLKQKCVSPGTLPRRTTPPAQSNTKSIEQKSQADH